MINHIDNTQIVCPNCFRLITQTRYTTGDVFYYAACIECGYLHSLTRIRDKGDINNDLGMFKFTCITNIYGCLRVLYNHNTYEDYITIDGDYVDTLIRDLQINRDLIKSAVLSYMKDNEIVKVDLMKLV